MLTDLCFLAAPITIVADRASKSWAGGMAKPGEIIENPVSGERIIFRTTASQTNGTYVEFDHIMKRGGGRTAEHVHLGSDERYEVISGTASCQIDGKNITCKAGDVVEIPRGTLHMNPWNSDTEELHLLRCVAPERGLELFYETQFGLAREGKVTPSGDMTLLQTIVVGDAIKSETYFVPRTLPIFVQKITVPVLAFIGRMIGLKARYPEFSS